MGPASSGLTVSFSCPPFKGSDVTRKYQNHFGELQGTAVRTEMLWIFPIFFYKTESAFRICSSSGEWLDRDGETSAIGWTNYSQCLTPEIREIIKKLGSDEEAQV